MSTTTLKASNGQYICAENGGGGVVVVNRPVAGLWETFEVDHVDATHVALRTPGGFYLCAEGGGGGDVNATRTARGPWETFEVIPAGDGAIALKADNGQYVCAEGGGGGELVANRSAIGPWETFTSSLAQASTLPDVGPILPLRIEGTRFKAAGGADFRFQGVAGFQAFQLWLDGARGQLDDFAGWCRGQGANALAFFGMWTQTGFDPRRYGARYYDEYPRYCAWSNSVGLRPWTIVWCDQAASRGSTIVMSRAEQDAHTAAMRPLLAQVGEPFEWMNEGWQNGIDVVRRMSGVPGVLSARGQFEDNGSLDQAIASVGPVLDFSTKQFARKFQWTRTAKDLLEVSDATGKPAVGREPPLGIYERTIPWSRSDDPRGFADWHGVAHLLGNGSFIHGDPENLQHCRIPGPRAQACTESIAAMWREDLPTGGAYTRGGPNAPLPCPLVHVDRFDDGDRELNTAGALRTFARIADNRATCLVVQPGRDWTPRGDHGWRVVGQRGPHDQIIDCER